MQATITYLLTQQAQRAQMAATGQPVARKQVKTLEVTADQLPLLAMAEDGTPFLDLTSSYVDLQKRGTEHLTAAVILGAKYSGDIPTVDDYGANILALIATGMQARQAKKEQDARDEAANRAKVATDWQHKIETEIAPEAGKFLAVMTDDPLAERSPTSLYYPTGCTLPPQLEALRQYLSDECERRVNARKAREEEARVDAERAKAKFIDRWMANQDDADMQHQHAEGLLCRQTVLGLIADEAFVAAGVPEAHPDSTVCQSRDCPCCDSRLDCLPRGHYRAWRGIKAGLPKGSKAEFRKVRDCLRDDWDGEGESATPAYYVADITMPHGPFQFTRRVKL